MCGSSQSGIDCLELYFLLNLTLPAADVTRIYEFDSLFLAVMPDMSGV